VYAGFAFVVAALLWTYFGWLILLAGAQLSFYVQNPTYLRLGLQQLRLSSVELEQLALKLMYFVGRAHVAGGPRWSVNRLATELGLPGIAGGADGRDARARRAADRDRQRRAGPGTRHRAHRRVRDTRHRPQPGQRPRRTPQPAHPPVDRLLAGVEDARRHRCGELTLRDLVDEAARPAAAAHSPAIVISLTSTEPVRIAARTSQSSPSATMAGTWASSCRQW